MYNPTYQITNSLLKSIGQIESAKAIIENAPLLPLYERQFKSEATTRRVHFSTAIEGNYLPISDVKKLVDTKFSIDNSNSEYLESIKDMQGNEVIARRRDIHEVINYRDVVSYIEQLNNADKLKDKKIRITEGLLFKLHKILLKNIEDDIAGKYRTSNALTVNFRTKERLYLYEDVTNVTQKIKELIEWYNSEEANSTHPVIKAGILHLEFVRIHPFSEANGRMARALATLSLSIDGYDIKNFFCLDEYYDSNAEDYYKYLQLGFTNLTKWLEYFVLGMVVEFNRIKNRVLKISKDAKVKARVGQLFISDRQEKIIEWLNNYGFFRNQDFETLFPSISDDTVLRELKGLLKANIIRRVGKTKNARYELS